MKDTDPGGSDFCSACSDPIAVRSVRIQLLFGVLGYNCCLDHCCSDPLLFGHNCCSDRKFKWVLKPIILWFSDFETLVETSRRLWNSVTQWERLGSGVHFGLCPVTCGISVSLADDPNVPSSRKLRLYNIASACIISKKKKSCPQSFCLNHGATQLVSCVVSLLFPFHPCRGSAPPDGSRQFMVSEQIVT